MRDDTIATEGTPLAREEQGERHKLHAEEELNIWQRYATPYDANEQHYVIDDAERGLISKMEALIIALNVLNVFLYLYEWTGVTTARGRV